MLKKILIAALALVAGVVVFLALGLAWAHFAIRRERAPLPSAQAILDTAMGEDRPVRLSVINTATQPMPRAAVLAGDGDSHPDEPYVMSHPSFVLEWADGRILLIDIGMNRAQALAFGKPIQTLSGGGPIQPLTSVADRLGPARQHVQGLVFTHLHSDHTGGIVDLCNGLDHAVPVFMTEAQARRPNFTTRAGLRLVREAGCTRGEALGDGALLRVAGFPGVFVIAAGGHTPGSQLIVAHLKNAQGERTVVFTGDIVNNIDGITYDIPKPFLYRLLVVPEDNARQAELRQFLRELRDRHGVTLLVSHDQRQIEQSGIPAW